MKAGPAVALLAGLTVPAAAADDPVAGIWGVASGDRVNCSALVMVLRDGSYSKAMLDLGTTQGPRDTVIGTATYRLSGDILEVAPSLSLARPEPRQLFHWDPVGQVLVRDRPAPRLTFRRCPDRPLNPMSR